jgi:hypothetical protein
VLEEVEVPIGFGNSIMHGVLSLRVGDGKASTPFEVDINSEGMGRTVEFDRSDKPGCFNAECGGKQYCLFHP